MKVGVEEGVPKYAPFPHPALSLYLTTLGFMAGRLVLVIPGRRPGKQTARVEANVCKSNGLWESNSRHDHIL